VGDKVHAVGGDHATDQLPVVFSPSGLDQHGVHRKLKIEATFLGVKDTSWRVTFTKTEASFCTNQERAKILGQKPL